MPNKLVVELVEVSMFFTDLHFAWELYNPTLYNQLLLTKPWMVRSSFN